MKGVIFQMDIDRQEHHKYAVYSLHDNNGVTQWVGCIPFASLTKLPDARKHYMFKYFFPYGKSDKVTVKILETFPTKREGIIWINQFFRTRKRPDMMKYRNPQRVAVRCVETREEFESLSACARAHDISQSSLSRHLNGDDNTLQIKGFSYELLC